MIYLVTDGADPELVEELCLARYFSSCLDGFDALQYLIMFIGSIAIQNGEHPRLVENRFLMCIPEDVSDKYNKKEHKMDGILYKG